MLLGRAGRAPAGHPLRRDTFIGDTLTPQIGRYVRRVGQPRQNWTTQVLNEAIRIAGSQARVELAIADAKSWKILFEHLKRVS